VQYYIWKQISFPEESTLTREYDDVPELNDNGSSEFDNFAEYDSDLYSNFDKVDEYNGVAEEFPMADDQYAAPSKSDVFGSSASKKAAEEAEKRDKEFVKRYLNISAAQVAAATFVALVAVSAIIIPAIENEDVEVYMDVGFENGYLYFFVELENTVDQELYYVVVLENDSLVYQKAIEDHYMSDSIGGMDPYKDHKVEVRSGHPPLLVLDSKSIPAIKTGITWDHVDVGLDFVDYGVNVEGIEEELIISLYDPTGSSNATTGEGDGVVVYSEAIYQGYNSDTIRDLRPGHQYYLTVSSESKTYLSEDIMTRAPVQVGLELSADGNTISYVANVYGDGDSVELCLVDSKTGEDIGEPRDMKAGENTGTYTGLFFDTLYVVVARSSSTPSADPYATSEIDTEPALEFSATDVTNNTITYNVLIRTTGVSYNVTVTDPYGVSVHERSITSTDGATIQSLEAYTWYTFTILADTGEEYVESVMTLSNVNATLDPDFYSIGYEVTLEGIDPTDVQAYLYHEGQEYASSRLSGNSNPYTGVFDNLASGETYTFKIMDTQTQSNTYFESDVKTDAAVTINSGPTVEGKVVSLNVTNNTSHELSVYLTDGRMTRASDTLEPNQAGKDVVLISDGIEYDTEYAVEIIDSDYGVDGITCYYSSVRTDIGANVGTTIYGNAIGYNVTIGDWVDPSTVTISLLQDGQEVANASFQGNNHVRSGVFTDLGPSEPSYEFVVTMENDGNTEYLYDDYFELKEKATLDASSDQVAINYTVVNNMYDTTVEIRVSLAYGTTAEPISTSTLNLGENTGTFSDGLQAVTEYEIKVVAVYDSSEEIIAETIVMTDQYP